MNLDEYFAVPPPESDGILAGKKENAPAGPERFSLLVDNLKKAFRGVSCRFSLSQGQRANLWPPHPVSILCPIYGIASPAVDKFS